MNDAQHLEKWSNDEGIPKQEIPILCGDLRRKVVFPHFNYLSSLGISSFVISLTIGCATLLAEQPQDLTAENALPASVRVVHGRPNRLLDGTGWILGTPNKLALWDRRADNHSISPATETRLVEYLEENNLDTVLVRVNQYDPLGEWRRMVANKQVGAGWRYSIGTLNLVKYTLLPGRLLGGDWYNPYSDTVHIYSDIPAIALSEGAYAKDVRKRKYPGSYSAVQEVPIVGMWHETIANREVLEYEKSHGTKEQQEETYRILYPDYGGTWGGQMASFLPYGNVFGRLAGAAVGHAANGVRTVTAHEKKTSTTKLFKNLGNKKQWHFH